MRNPFLIDGPALISFSGGRTSGYMLRQILDAHGGSLPADYRVAFANTGKERPETLDFVRDCAEAWGVAIQWVEYRADGFIEVAYDTASRAGEPFAALIGKKKYLPNPVARFCTQEMKIKALHWVMRSAGFAEWTSVIGIRADEPSRVAKMRAPNRSAHEDRAVPLADAGVTEVDVLAFWDAQPFNLQLRRWEGNCDLCFLKGRQIKQRVIQDRPDLADWWIEQERRIGNSFRADAIGYAAMLDSTQRQGRLPLAAMEGADDLGDCVCHD